MPPPVKLLELEQRGALLQVTVVWSQLAEVEQKFGEELVPSVTKNTSLARTTSLVFEAAANRIRKFWTSGLVSAVSVVAVPYFVFGLLLMIVASPPG